MCHNPQNIAVSGVEDKVLCWMIKLFCFVRFMHNRSPFLYILEIHFEQLPEFSRNTMCHSVPAMGTLWYNQWGLKFSNSLSVFSYQICVFVLKLRVIYLLLFSTVTVFAHIFGSTQAVSKKETDDSRWSWKVCTCVFCCSFCAEMSFCMLEWISDFVLTHTRRIFFYLHYWFKL